MLVLVIRWVWNQLLPLGHLRCTASARLLITGSPSVCKTILGYPISFRKALPAFTAKGYGPFLFTAVMLA